MRRPGHRGAGLQRRAGGQRDAGRERRRAGDGGRPARARLGVGGVLAALADERRRSRTGLPVALPLAESAGGRVTVDEFHHGRARAAGRSATCRPACSWRCWRPSIVAVAAVSDGGPAARPGGRGRRRAPAEHRRAGAVDGRDVPGRRAAGGGDRRARGAAPPAGRAGWAASIGRWPRWSRRRTNGRRSRRGTRRTRRRGG